MIRQYYKEPYQREAEVQVTRIDGNKVFFDSTIFYPEGGGQPGDRGTFNGIEILDTQKDGDDVAHIFKSSDGIKTGDTGILILDWGHRYSFMKRHSAQHLLSSVFFKTLGIGTLAVHLADEHVTIELDRKDVSPEDLFTVESVANELVRKGLMIEQKDLLRGDAEELHMRRSIKVDDGVVKVVFIEDQDAVACGGVHVSNTREIGEISFYSTELIRGHLRTIWKVDDEAVRNRRGNLTAVCEISELLSSPHDEIVPSLKARLDELERLRREVRGLSSRIARMEASSIAGDCSVYMTDLPLEEFRDVLVSNERKDILIIRDGEKKEFLYIGSEEHFTVLKKLLSLKGGGRNSLFQGSYSQRGDVFCSLAEEVINGFKR